jgi:hypothetical protein
MIRCNNCGTENLDGSQYCDECGMRLSSDRSPIYQPPPAQSYFGDEAGPPPPSFSELEPPKPVRPARIDNSAAGAPLPNKTMVLSSQNSAELEAKAPRVMAKLVIERGGRIGKEFPIVGVETYIGRWDADNGIFPDVDLDEDDPQAKVSRRHARIINQGGQFFVEDLGSTNGTFVNRGRRLLPGHKVALRNGDEIIVGKTFLKFHIVQ